MIRVSDNNRLNSLLDAARRLIIEFPSHRTGTFEELAQWIPLGNLAVKIRRQPVLGYQFSYPEASFEPSNIMEN